jgi:hypothetical protein
VNAVNSTAARRSSHSVILSGMPAARRPETAVVEGTVPGNDSGTAGGGP